VLIDRKLRNKIAHYKFSVDDKSRIYIDGKQVDIKSKIISLFVTGKMFGDYFDVIRSMIKEDGDKSKGE
jgi:UDP-N-acetylglucosamine 2-epimerase